MLSLFLALIDEESDKELFTRVYEQYQKQMYSVAYKILKDEQLSEDATHDVFIRIAINIKILRKVRVEAVRSYLLISARNAALDILKKRNKINTVNIDNFFSLQDVKASDAFDNLGEDKIIVSVLAQLPTTYTDVMYLRLVADLSDKEIAQYLNRNINTVRQQFKRGKKIFAELYEKEQNT